MLDNDFATWELYQNDFLNPCKALGAIESLQIETEVFWTLKYKQDWTRQDDIKAIIIIQ